VDRADPAAAADREVRAAVADLAVADAVRVDVARAVAAGPAVAVAAAAAVRADRSREVGCDHSSEPRPFWLAAKRRLAASSLARVPFRHASLTASLPVSLFAARSGRGPKE
jgi:hypothetical protein